MNAPDRAVAKGGHVGAATVRGEDQRFLTGSARFTDDVRIERMVHAAVLRSPHANARILRLDASAALATKGVLLAMTAADLGGKRPVIPIRLAPLPGLERFLQHAIAADRVRFVGEPVALVVAESRYIAEDALDRIAVDYDPIDPVTGIDQAMQDKALVHEAVGSNIGSHYHVSRGDPERGFARAEYTRKERFRCHRHTAAPMETRGMVAEYDGTLLRVWGATKVPFFNRRVLAGMLALPESSIDMIETDIGGGFGVRGEFYPEDFLVPWAAIQLRRPVKWIEDRREHLMATNHARETECELEIGMKRDGTIVGMRATVMADLGAYARTGGGVALARVPQFLPGPYRIPDYACEVFAIFSNKTPVGTYRGPGRYEANFFRERLLDMAAADLGLDPIVLREKNLVSAAEIPYDIGSLVPFEGPNAYDGGDFHSAYRQALDAIDYASLPKNGAVIDGRLHGVGVACFTESSGAGPSESARIVACPDGRYEIYSGVATMGQGHETVFAQIAGDELGVPPPAFRVFHGSTAYVDQGWGTYHSRAVVVGGSAVKIAAEAMREKLIALAAKRSGVAAADLRLGAGVVIREDDGSTVLDVGRLAQAARDGDAEAQDATQVKARFDIKMRTYSYGCHVAHVAVDPETAQAQVLSYVALEDVGHVINPLLAHGQAVGGAVQGIGATFLDELLYDDSGQLITGTFADYLVPTSTEAPPVTAILLEEAPSASNPLGAKGAGEGGIVATGAAVANAVANALSPLGVRITALPLSLNNLAASIRAARSRK
jgi:carbon-monoxide dehydrogenase large subunit